MISRTRALEFLKNSVNDTRAEFRSGQWEAIDAVVNRRERLLVVERTGWGKSSVYFIATRALRDAGRGMTLIVSPLLALMRNQLVAAERLGITAHSINSTNTSDWPELIRQLQTNSTDALLISPERLANEQFYSEVLYPLSNSIGMLVVDEAHCISDWGHDFRPDYKRIVNVIRVLPKTTAVIGTTATANSRVVGDVVDQLGGLRVQRGNLMRRSLHLQCMRLPTQSERLAWLAEHIGSLPGTGIIYTLTKRDAQRVANWLQQHGILAEPYFSGVRSERHDDTNECRLDLEDKLQRNQLKALVATTALGMGYDKPDLGFVVHFQTPSSIIAYYQQVGRAGRRLDHAIGLLMSGEEDQQIIEYFRRTAFPRETWVNRILKKLEDADGLSARKLEQSVNLRTGQIQHVLKYLSALRDSPVVKAEGKWRRTSAPYRMDHAQITRLSEQRDTEYMEVQEYIDSQGCLMQFLANSLDSPDTQPCGKCAPCQGRPVVEPHTSHAYTLAANRFLRRSEEPLECKKQTAAGAFPNYGFPTNLPLALRHETGRVLSRWGDAGWGNCVAADKQAGRFRDELVEAVVEMLNVRWRPQPSPQWITCIPSDRSLHLVPDFTSRLSAKLKLPFIPAVHKVNTNQPQKEQHNRFHQCRNLDGVFRIVGSIPDGPVLLVDDVVDSGWTIAVAAALLQTAGSGPVYPVALASAKVGG